MVFALIAWRTYRALSDSMIQASLDFNTTPEVRLALSRLGRTEDLRLSPSGRLLAIAGFSSDRIIVFRLKCTAGAGKPEIHLTDFVEFSSPALSHPHGIAFFDERTVGIANRTGKVGFFRIPRLGQQQKHFRLKPLGILRGGPFNQLHSPGSLDAYGTGGDCYRLLICNNYVHAVTEAEVRLNGSCSVRKHRVLLKKYLEIPDGINVSANRKWIAVSNHVTGSLFVYRNGPALGIDSEPVAELHGMDCPHGVRFTADDRRIIVVDAADPTLCVYACGPEGWSGVYQPSRVIRVMDDETFALGRYNVEEGGPKGIDIDESAGIVCMTSEYQPLTFYSLDELLRSCRNPTASPRERSSFGARSKRETGRI